MGCANSSSQRMPVPPSQMHPPPSSSPPPSADHPLSVPDKMIMGTKPLPAYTSSSSPDMLPPPPPPPLEDYSPESPTCGYGIGFTDQYKLGETLGTGNFSVVREALHKPSGQRYAIKCIKKGGLSNDELEALTTEVAVLKQMKHPNIMILHDFFSEPDYYYLVTEYMDGGELFDRVVEKSYYSEREARDLVKLLLEAIKYCHECNVVHRDLKPENLLLTSKMDDASIKLADFGFAKRVDMHDEGLKTACGTPGYVAPEILESRPYGKSVDIWSIGVITYILLCGYPPFNDDNHHALFRKIKQGQFEFDAPYWDAISDDAKHFIGQMLVVDNKLRATAAQLLEHPWIVGSQVSTVQLSSALDELRRFTARDKFKGAVRAIMAQQDAAKAKQATSLLSTSTTANTPLVVR
ncbi:CAMK/CAMK1 protein kinase, variant 1 [Aphanomyces astaci]|uniref:non-specific serine/threonine protein kinase n=1 Tax=Aphanomyces astaci TaxID=112090 RepID=W4FI82_APHAT|nr:CAMK/CAMK1 protein kinase, variant 1 [Aphanomyces astaci]ETV67185.1 CAMK/CAMK1 protein kinase, variant 1 [Aphanomyces astaci]|eukprot:XP_009843349.1 CAMK/CAMK1 protein kinase, variant 1 [Aphanomyces astaci]